MQTRKVALYASSKNFFHYGRETGNQNKKSFQSSEWRYVRFATACP